MQKRRTWMVAPLVALLLNLAAVGALADPITLPPEGETPVIVTADPTAPSTTITTTTTVPSSTITSTTTTTADTTSPSVTTTTGTTVPSTTVQAPLPTPTPIIQIITTQPITIDTTTVVAPTTSTPLGGSITVGGPGTTGSVPIATNVDPALGMIVVEVPTITATVPTTIPTVTSSGTAPISTDGTTYDAAMTVTTVTGALDTTGTAASATVTEPANGISVSARAAAAVCLLANVVGRTTLDPAATAYLSTLCGGSASTADATAGATVGQLASGSVGLAASICLVANALALPSPFLSTSPLVTASLASAGLDTRCGTGPSMADLDSSATALDNTTIDANGAVAACLLASALAGIPSTATLDTRCSTGSDLGPSTATADSTATLLENATIDANGAAAVCLLASALAGLPTTVELSTACGTAGGLTPSIVTGGVTGTTPLGGVTADLSAALCVVAHAIADVPTTATLTTACADLPSTLVGELDGKLAGAGGTLAPNVSTCIVLNSIVPGMTSLGESCGTSETPSAAAPVSGAAPVLGIETGPGGDIGSINPILEPSSGVQDTQTTRSILGMILGQLGITSLPGTSTVVGGGLLGLALIGLGVAFLRRPQAANS